MKEKQRYITLPEDWDELTEADWRELLRIRHIVASTDMQWTVEDVRIESARAMLRNRGGRQQLNNPQWLKLVNDLAQTLTWLWTEERGLLSLVYRSADNKMPAVTIGKGKAAVRLTGPAPYGYDLTFGEFRQAVQHLKAYEHPTGDSEADRIEYRTKALCALAGLLYRPETTVGGRTERQPYDWDSLDEKIRRGQQMKPWQLWGIYAWTAYFCEALATETFIIEGEEVCFAPLFENPTPNPSPQRGGESGGGGLQQICLTLAESHVFGTACDVDRTPLLTVMQKLLLDYHTLMKLKKRKT
mgnify:FL=1